MTAFRAREESWNASLKPIYVDSSKDTMCFIIVNREHELDEVEKSFDYTLPLEPSLKIHDSIYSFVEAELNTKMVWPHGTPDDITLFYQMQSFNESRVAEDHFRQMLKSMTSYSAATFESFFWTAEKTSKYFASAPPSVAATPQFVGDEYRKEMWIKAAQSFHSRVLPVKMHDPCGFTAVATRMTVENVGFIF